MTAPEEVNRLGLTSVGLFMEESKEGDATRARLAAIGMDWFRQCQSERNRQERQWYLNYAFFSGNQYSQFRQIQNGSFDLYIPKAPYYKVRITINKVRQSIRKEISRLTAQKPNAQVIPASSEDADIFAAQAGEQIWDSLWRRLKVNKVIREAVFWQAVTGCGYIKSYWDPTKVDPEANMKNQDGQQKIYGDIVIAPVTPFHIFVPDLMEQDLEAQPYLIYAQAKERAWVKQNFNIDVSDAVTDSVESNVKTVMNLEGNDKKNGRVIVLEVWVKPGTLSELPDGGMFTIANNQIVQGFDYWPYDHGQYPVAKLDGVPSGKFYGSSVIEDLIPLQRELNRSRSQLIESKNHMSKPQLLAEKGSVDPKRITSEPGLVIEYNPGLNPPQPLPLQNLPSYVTEEINRLYQDISDISGQHEVSNGSTPPGVTAATAISFLQEQDESMIAAYYTSIEEAVEKIAAQSLVYVQSYWDEERTVKVVGLEGTFDVQTFKSSDLRGNSDIRIEGGSSLPTSRAAKQAFIMDLMKMGFIDPNQGLEFLEVGGLNKIYERIQVDKRQAQRENLKMRVITQEDVMMHQQTWLEEQPPEAQTSIEEGLQLEPPPLVPVNTWDNHQVHIDEHNNYRKSQYFDSADPFTKQIFEEHVRMHQEAIMGQMPSNFGTGDNPDPTMDQGMGENGEQPPGPEQMPEMSEEMSPDQHPLEGE